MKPNRFKIVPDDYHARIVGKKENDEQFFITNPFGKNEYLAVFIWNKDGSFKEAKIDNLGPRDKLDEKVELEFYKKRLSELGKIRSTTIEVEPFEVERFDEKFGLIYSSYEDDGNLYETVELYPGNYMAFYPPWEGDYDT